MTSSARVLLAVAVSATLALPGAGLAGSPSQPALSRVRVLAVAPFDDWAPLTGPLAGWGASRLAEIVSRGPFQVVPPRQVAEVMKRMGMVSADLLSPSRAVEVGRQVGADAVLTGRVVYLMQERERDELGPSSVAAIMSRVDVDIRVLEVSSRLALFQQMFTCHVPGTAVAAMECVVWDAATQLGIRSAR